MKPHAQMPLEASPFPRVELGELVAFRRGLTYAKSDEVEFSSTAVLRANNVDLATGELDLSEIRYISDDVEVPHSKKLVGDSLLICTASGSRSHLGKMAHVSRELDLAFGGFMGLLVPGSQLFAKYLWYFSRSSAYREHLEAMSPGANINNLRFDNLARLTLPCPSLDEQKRIVAALDQAFSALNRARESIEASASDSARLADAWLKASLENNCDWPVRRLGDVCENLDRQRVPITKADRESGDIPYYGASGVVDYVKGFLFDEELLLVSEDGANLLARTSPIAFSIRGKAWVNNHAHVLRFSHQTTQEFVRLYLNSISMRPFVTGMAQPKLNQGTLNAIPVPMPPMDVQVSIVAAASEVEAASNEALAVYRSQLNDIATLGQSLLQAAFSGQLN